VKEYDFLSNTCMLIFFGIALWASGMIYLLPLKRKDRFWFRTVFFLFFGVIVNAFIITLYKGEYESFWLKYILYYIFFVLLFWGCGQVSFLSALYNGIWSFLTFEFAYKVRSIIIWLDIAMIFDNNWRWLNHLWTFLLLDTVLGFTIARWMPEKGRCEVGPRKMTSAFLLLIIYQMLNGMLYQSGKSTMIASTWEILVLIQIIIVLVLYLQSILFKKSSMQQQMMVMDLLWHQQKEQYHITKENIDLINRKCHDLKHQMIEMRGMIKNEAGERYLNEIENSIRIYDAIVKTGNEVLDTILTEKSLYCEANQIHISCVADGSKLNFMNPTDLYTIFGNAFDNAIESVLKFAEEEKRLIDVRIYQELQFLVVKIINPLANELNFKDELPVTTKARNGYHGFGLKSIRHSVQRYHGSVSVNVEDGCFCLKIVIPVP